MEVELQNSETSEVSDEQEVPYISPEVSAAQAGEAVDFSKNFVDTDDETDGELIATRIGPDIN